MSHFAAQARDFSCPQYVKTGSGTHQHPTHSTSATSLVEKRSGCKDDHSHSFSAEVKNEWKYTSIPHVTPSCAQRQLYFYPYHTVERCWNPEFVTRFRKEKDKFSRPKKKQYNDTECTGIEVNEKGSNGMTQNQRV